MAGSAQGAGIDEPLASLTAVNTAFFEADGVGSITSLSGMAGITDTYTYDAFGVTTATGANPNRFRYTGREWDPETGLYYYRARYYDPQIGRFLSEDPLGVKAGVNFYRYVRNNPVLFTDPNGLYELRGFPPAKEVALRYAIEYQLKPKLKPGCCAGALGPKLLDLLESASFVYTNPMDYYGRPVAGEVTPLDFVLKRIELSDKAFDDPCPLAGIVLHELVHLTWRKVLEGQPAREKDAYDISSKCFGAHCADAQEP